METIALGSSGRSTTLLGFGCSSLMGSMGRKSLLANAAVADDASLADAALKLYALVRAEAVAMLGAAV